MYNFFGKGLKNILLIIALLIVVLLIIVIGNTNKLYAFTQDRTFVFTPSVGGYYTNNSSDHFLPDLAIDATYVLSDNLEAGIGLAIQKTNLHATNTDPLSLPCPECLNDDSVVVPLYVILKSNIILNYKESISFYGKLGAVLDSETHVNANDASIVYEPNAYVAVGVDYVYKNIVFGVVYKAINVRERLEIPVVGIEDKNTIDSNYFNNYFGLRLGYNLYTVITPATE